MKKIIAIVLSLTLCISIVSIAASAKDDFDLKFAVASDLHYVPTQEKLEKVTDDDIYWYANRRAELENEIGFIIDEFLNQCANNDCEYVLVSGDLTSEGRRSPDDHRAVAEKFRKFEAETGKQIFVIDGNHDVGETDENSTDYKLFKEIYAEFGYDKALTVDENTCSYTADLGDKYRLIALDSCDYSASTEDGMTTERVEWVHQQAKQAKEDGKYPILMMHHNLIDHMPLQRIISRNFIVRFHYTTAELFADWGIKVVLTGHEHCSDVSTYTSALGNKIYDFATTSLIMYPIEYRTLTFNEDEIKYDTCTVDSIDTAALTKKVDGYTQSQISLMNKGFNDYSKGFLKTGVKYRLQLSLTMEKMGIDKDDFYYNIVNTAVGRLNELLEMPLYGNNSVQELAAEYNIKIADSDYKNGWDVATEFVASHYAGEEKADMDSVEMSILLNIANLIIKDDLATVSDKALFGAAEEILKSIGINCTTSGFVKQCTKYFGPVSDGQYLIIAIASPFLYEFASDNDNVNDNRGTIDGYGTVSIIKNISNISTNMSNIIAKIQTYLSLFLKYFSKIFGNVMPYEILSETITLLSQQ